LTAVQAAPVFLDTKASLAKACGLIAEAGANGATLTAFAETWLPGYPRFVNAAIPIGQKRQFIARYIGSAVTVPGPEIDELCAAAADANTDVVMGVAELDPNTRGTAYCTLVFIGSDGTLLGTHRKLKPTSGERTVWGEGDGSGLVTYDRPFGKLSGLNCWEHNMVLPGYALMAEGTQIHVAAFPGYEVPGKSTTRQLLLARAFASQAAAYVVLVGGVLRPEDVPDDDVREAIASMASLTGDSAIIDPRGEILAGPGVDEEILYAEGSLDEVRSAKALCDVAGHYSRPDVLRLTVNRTPARRAVEEAE
jgi:predicted amidohydrolase